MQQVNAVISAIVAGEFPLMGAHWKLIEACATCSAGFSPEEEATAF